MRETDIKALNVRERFRDGVNPQVETESRLGVQLPKTRALIGTMHADLAEGQPHGIRWWEPKASSQRAPRILISDYLYSSAAQTVHHFVAARLHYLEFVDWSQRDERARNERTRIAIPRHRNVYPKSVEEYLFATRADAHRAQIVLSLASALDCMAATIVGVCAVPIPIKTTQFGAILKELGKKRKKPQSRTVETLQAAIAQDIAAAVEQSGPTGWRNWLAQYRNALAHRGLRQTTHSLSDEVGLVAPDLRPATVRDTGHLPTHPGFSEVEGFLAADPIGSIGLSENERTTLEGLVGSAMDLTERISERLGHVWKDRAKQPEDTPQPFEEQWQQPDGREWSEFVGYAPGSDPIDPQGAVNNPTFRKRLLAAALDDAQRSVWEEPDMKCFIPTAPEKH